MNGRMNHLATFLILRTFGICDDSKPMKDEFRPCNNYLSHVCGGRPLNFALTEYSQSEECRHISSRKFSRVSIITVDQKYLIVCRSGGYIPKTVEQVLQSICIADETHGDQRLYSAEQITETNLGYHQR